MNIRLFIAVEINEEIRKKLAEFQNALKSQTPTWAGLPRKTFMSR